MFEILPDANYPERALRIFAALQPQYGTFADGRLMLTPKGRLAYVLSLTHRDDPLSASSESSNPIEDEHTKPLLEFAFDRIRDRRLPEQAVLAHKTRRRGARDGRLYVAIGPHSLLDEIAGLVLIGGPSEHLAAMFLRQHEELAEHVMSRIRDTYIGADANGENEWLEYDGLTCNACELSHPDLVDYMAGFLEGLTATWRDYLRYERGKKGEEGQ